MMLTGLPYRVVLADDDATFRLNLKRLLGEIDELEVAGEAGDGLELLSFLGAATAAPQLAIIDISMPNVGGIEAVGQIKNTHPETKVLILTMHGEAEYVQAALSAGADGYLLKPDIAAHLHEAIKKLRLGEICLSPCLRQPKRI